ncbi:MAG: SMI1/KNR4 family protein [Phycisphaerae bacterium]|jgi:hypothetical protein
MRLGSRFDEFAAELAKYDCGVHRLIPGASEEAIAVAERALGVTFFEDYKAFLHRWNGGLMFAKEFFDLLIWSVDDEATRDMLEYNTEAVRENTKQHAEYGLPAHLLGIAQDGGGDLTCLDFSEPPSVVRWSVDERKVESRWSTMIEWLEYEMELGRDMYDYHGDEREGGE